MGDRLFLNKNYEGAFDILIVGGGLSGLCYAYQLKIKQPHLSFKIFESQDSFACDKTWSFHQNDVSNINLWKDFLTASWNNYDVQFSKKRTTVNLSYHTILARDFFSKMQHFLRDHLMMGAKIEEISDTHVKTTTGRTFFGTIVIDARSIPKLTLPEMQKRHWGFQKFVGLEIKTRGPHRLNRPLLMDANIDQTDGYRFIYALPLTEETLLIEDTYYSNNHQLPVQTSISDLKHYAFTKHWPIETVMRTETGVLPIPLHSLKSSNESIGGQPFFIGTGADFYHPVTGYSFLWSTRVAEALSDLSHPTKEQVAACLRKLQNQNEKTRPFYLFLNRLMFLGSDETNRKNIFSRFYRLPVKTISRFYSGQTNFIDKLRLLVGRPPIPVITALKIIFPALQTSNKLIASDDQI